MMSRKVVAFGVVAGLAAIAVAKPGEIDAVARDEAMMRGDGERCEGAEGYEFVEWVPCADGLVCAEVPEMGWGKFCVNYRGDGERCMGAEGYEAVAWIPCAEGLACEDKPEMGWGKFCVAAEMPADTPTRGEGERCMGIEGEETVEWIPCAEGLECMESPDMGWGKFCLGLAPLSDTPVYPPGGGPPMDAPTTADNPPPVITTAGEVCTENWQTCGGRGPEDVERPCCNESYTCVDAEEEGYEGLRCEPKKM